jgi:nucleoside-diphosphate-sugar epimerase
MSSPKTVVIFGATSPIGQRLAELAIAAGCRTLAVVRAGSDAQALAAAGTEILRADALDAEAVAAATAAVPDGALFASVLGGPPGSDGRLDWEGNRNAIDAARARQAGHFVLVTTVGAGDSRPALPPPVIAILGPLADKKTLAEAHLKASGLNWTVLRPGHLQSGEPTGRAVLVADPRTLGAVQRADVAALIMRCFDHPACHNRAFAVTDLDAVRSPHPLEPVALD